MTPMRIGQEGGNPWRKRWPRPNRQPRPRTVLDQEESHRDRTTMGTSQGKEAATKRLLSSLIELTGDVAQVFGLVIRWRSLG